MTASLVIVTGVFGAGKTTLAQHFLEQYRPTATFSSSTPLLGIEGESVSTAPVLVQDKSNLLRIREEIPLGESQIAALENVPTAAGPTLLELRGESLAQIQHARSVGRLATLRYQ